MNDLQRLAQVVVGEAVRGHDDLAQARIVGTGRCSHENDDTTRAHGDLAVLSANAPRRRQLRSACSLLVLALVSGVEGD